MARTLRFGTERGAIFPHQEAAMLLSFRRRLVQDPGSAARHMALRPSDTVLELGCGPGYFSPSLAKRLRRGRLVLFDIQTEMLQMARSAVRDRGLTASAVAGDALALPFASGSFDAVFLSAVLGETGDREQSLAEIRRVLRTGGRLGVSEIRGDDDFIPREVMQQFATDAGFTRDRSFGRDWNYTETFVAV